MEVYSEYAQGLSVFPSKTGGLSAQVVGKPEKFGLVPTWTVTAFTGPFTSLSLVDALKVLTSTQLGGLSV